MSRSLLKFASLLMSFLPALAWADGLEVKTFGHGENRLEVNAGKEVTTLAIISPFGIGRGEVKRTGEKWPPLQFDCHLTGLESLEVTVGKKTLVVWVSSGGDHQVYASLKEEGSETSLTSKSPLWPQVRVLEKGGMTSKDWNIPLKGQYIQVDLPAPLLADNPAEIKVQWIDFYRN